MTFKEGENSRRIFKISSNPFLAATCNAVSPKN